VGFILNKLYVFDEKINSQKQVFLEVTYVPIAATQPSK